MAHRFGEGWRGALLRGPSGAGKSELALRATACGFRLVADDRVLAWRSGSGLFGRAPTALAGLIEVRGVGVRPVAEAPLAPIRLVVDLGEGGERVPADDAARLLGVDLPRLTLSPRGEGAPLRLRQALARATGRPLLT